MPGETGLAPLELPGWLEFNSWRTGLRAHRFSSSSGGPEIRAVLYFDRRGRVTLPPNNPYLPIVFKSGRHRPSGRTSEWLNAVDPLVDEICRRGAANRLRLVPDVTDVRPWRWHGFAIDVGYTYCLDFPMDPTLVDRCQRRGAERAAQQGMTVERVPDIKAVVDCLIETQERKRIVFGLSEQELRAAQQMLGEDGMRTYVCFDSRGCPASSCVILHAPGHRAIGWLAGMKRAHMADGAGHLVWRAAFDDLAAAGATGLDLCGGELRPTGEFKARWGAALVPVFCVLPQSPLERILLARPHLGIARVVSRATRPRGLRSATASRGQRHPESPPPDACAALRPSDGDRGDDQRE